MLDLLKNRPESPTLFDLSVPGRSGVCLPESDPAYERADDLLDLSMQRDHLCLPAVSELESVRHWVHLSQRNWAIDVGFYPLGSCTMKYNPKINEEIASNPRWAGLHPLQPDREAQGILAVLYETERMLESIGGMARVSLLPAAGAQAELIGLMLVQKYHEERGEPNRSTIIVPDSSHGTNPASAARLGYKVVTLRSNESGCVDPERLGPALHERVAAVMLTNPNTLGLFERDIETITRMAHETGALCYCDGANMNAIMGVARPGDMGFDLMHFNLHKTFSTPHGGGGPGAGAIGVQPALEPFLPVPLLKEGLEGYSWDYDRPRSVGAAHSFYGNVLIALRAYVYLKMLGRDGLRDAAEKAVLNASYLASRIEGLEFPYGRRCMHECVASAKGMRKHGVRALDIAKRLIDLGVHPCTVYFPLIVEEALMIEPTETEAKSRLDAFIEALSVCVHEANADPGRLKNSPAHSVVRRIDEAEAVRRCDVCFGG
ncbi:MAG: aminomethyl-transferring glycine dehydrogenase subunit GcvPB [Armatimonadetes bacterium]|nr:aminomethyl-transferring glycine dehydrogenase subunit GcvPB [Armatimonadota bacterium]